MKLGNVVLKFTGIEIGPVYYFYWWNWLSPTDRYWGREDFYYDGPHRTFGLWFTNLSWSTPWTRLAEENYPKL